MQRDNNNILNEVNTMRRQMGLPVLNENELLHLELSQINLDPLNEGWWENAKYALSKLGRYKAGGKIFGKSQTDAKANAQIMGLLDKKGNEMIKQLDASIKEKNPEFPNNKSQLDFVNTVIEIATVYDSLVNATKLKPGAPGYLPVDAANAIIEDLRAYSQKYLDVDLTAAFSVFNEGEELEEASSPAQQAAIAISKKENGINEAEGDLDAAKAQAAGKFAGTKAAIKKGDMEAYNTERMKTLKSWKLPMALLGAGASFGALSWLIEYIFPPEKITSMTPEEVKQTTQQLFGNIKPGEGMTQIMNRTLGTNLSPTSNPNDVVSALSKLGGGNAQTGVDIITQKGGIFANPEAAKATLSELVKNPTAHGSNLKQVFAGTWAGTGKAAGDTLVTMSGGNLVGLVTKAIITWTTKTTVIKSAKAIIAAPILKTIGIGLFAGGVAAALARWKGRKSSRAQVLNDLIQYLRPSEGTKENPVVIGNEDGGGNKNPQGGEDKNKQGGSGDQQLYNDLKKYFQDVFNFKSQTNTDTYGQGGSSNPTKQYTGGQKVTQKITQPNDINDIIKLMEGDVELVNLLEGLNRLIEADDSLGRSINAKGQAAAQKNTNDKGINDVGLSSNQVKLFKTNVNRLSNIVKAISKVSSQDKNFEKLLGQAKSNPLSTMDINSLLVSDDKSLKIFVSDFNKAVYSVQFKNGNNIMDQLKLVGINKLNEAAERVPGKGEMNKVYNQRREFLKNLPNYLKSMYAIFSFLIDKVKKGDLTISKGDPNKGQGNKQKQGGNQQGGDQQGGDQQGGDQQGDNEQGGNQQGNNQQGGGQPDKKGGKFYGDEFYEGVELGNLIETHNNLIDIILESVTTLDEFGDDQPEMKQGMEDAMMNSNGGQIFQELATIIPDLSAKVAASYKQKYNKPINRVKLADFLSVVIGSLAKVPTSKMISIIGRADLDATAYKRMLKDVMTADNNAADDAAKEPAKQQGGMKYNPANPEKFMPEKVGSYDLSQINQAARIALSQKAAQIISRNNDMEQSSENMLEVIKQLIDDINKNGQKKIPTV
jgi:hypothetical protein